MKVAVPFPQHSPWLGHRPLAQMVWRPLSLITRETPMAFSPRGSLIFSHSGFLLLLFTGIVFCIAKIAVAGR
jgi:hypothetical protein